MGTLSRWRRTSTRLPPPQGPWQRQFTCATTRPQAIVTNRGRGPRHEKSRRGYRALRSLQLRRSSQPRSSGACSAQMPSLSQRTNRGQRPMGRPFLSRSRRPSARLRPQRAPHPRRRQRPDSEACRKRLRTPGGHTPERAVCTASPVAGLTQCQSRPAVPTTGASGARPARRRAQPGAAVRIKRRTRSRNRRSSLRWGCGSRTARPAGPPSSRSRRLPDTASSSDPLVA